MEKNRLDLEQEILDCWSITTDLDDLLKYIMDSPALEGIDPKSADKIGNILIGLIDLYNIKFDRTFNTFETCLHRGEIKSL